MGTFNHAPFVSIGEAPAGNNDYSNIRLTNRIEARIQRSTTNLGAFNWTNGGNDPISDGSFQLSEPLAVSVTKDETLNVRYGIHKFDTTLNSQRPAHRTSLRFGNNTGTRNVTDNMSAFLTGTSVPTYGALDTMGDILYVRVTSTTLRAVRVEGSSIGYGGNGWAAASSNIQNGLPASSAVDGAASAAELTARQDGLLAANTGMVWHNVAESGSNLFQQYAQGWVANDAYRPGRFRARQSEKLAIGYTDVIYSCFVNETASLMSGFNLTNALNAWEESVRNLIRLNQSLNCRTWIFLEGPQTTWTGGGTAWDLALSDAAYRDGQTPSNNAVTSITAYRAALVDRIHTICNELGSAWIFDTAKVTHALNVRGELVWNKGRTNVAATTGNDGTHPAHDHTFAIRDAAIPFFGGRNATSFPAFGLLNP